MVRILLGTFITLAICMSLTACGNGGGAPTNTGGGQVREVPQEKVAAPGSDISPEAKTAPGGQAPPSGN